MKTPVGKPVPRVPCSKTLRRVGNGGLRPGERRNAEGPDPTLRKISVADYWLHYKLMQATGTEKELGGEAQTIEALKALGEAYECKLRVAEEEVPKMIPAAFGAASPSSSITTNRASASSGRTKSGEPNSCCKPPNYFRRSWPKSCCAG
jgi:hypothetical protein